MRCVIWAAVSSKPQAADEKDSIPSQIARARDFIRGHDGWHEAHEPLIIPGHSRSYIFLSDAALEMPVYTELMGLARSGSIDLLICRGRDRLGRTAALIAQVESYLAHHHVQVFSLDMPSRIQDPQEFRENRDRGQIWTGAIERARSEDEVATMLIRHRLGMKRRTQDGYHPNVPPYGYRLNEQGVGEIYEPEARVVRLIYRWFLNGLSLTEIDRRLPDYTAGHRPARTTLPWTLQNPYYKGVVAWGRRDHPETCQTAPGLHQAIIEPDLWDAVQREYAARQKQGPRAAIVRNPLSGFVFCAHCGCTMGVDRAFKFPLRQYVCREKCGNKVRVVQLEELVAAWIAQIVDQPDLLESYLKTTNSAEESEREAEIEQLREVIAVRQGALARWQADYETQIIDRDEYYSHRWRLEEAIALSQARLDELASHNGPPIEAAQVVTDLQPLIAQKILDNWHDREASARCKAVFRRLGLRIDVNAPEITLRLAANG